MLIETKAYARAGFVGNPSDGYFGKTIAFCFKNFSANIVIYHSPELEILPSKRDHRVFKNIESLAADVNKHGYYGGFRLLKATIKCFYDYCLKNHIKLEQRNFTLRYTSDVPNRVGLAGSSAIITACMRALMNFYQVEMPGHILANLVLHVERKELAIPAGLQDRVAQAYQGVVYMDFDRNVMLRRGYGQYETLPSDTLPLVYVAYMEDLSEGTEVFHNDMRVRFNRKDPEVLEAMTFWADLTDRVKEKMIALQGASNEEKHAQIGPLLDANFDQRRRLYPISAGNIAMIEAARSVGASAKFAGSGGAIVGTYASDENYTQLKEALTEVGAVVFKPELTDEIGAKV
jgi:glucuronokinase